MKKHEKAEEEVMGRGIRRHLPREYEEKLRKCPICGEQFRGRGIKKGRRYPGNKKYCSTSCKYKAWEQRNPRVPSSELEAFRTWQKKTQKTRSNHDFSPL